MAIDVLAVRIDKAAESGALISGHFVMRWVRLMYSASQIMLVIMVDC